MNTQTRDGIQIIMLGPALDVRGGVSSVERLILAHAPADVHIHHIATMRDGSRWRKMFVFLSAAVRLVVLLLTKRVHLVHIHFASHASTWRKSLLAMLTHLAGKPYILHAHGGGFRDFYFRQPRLLQRWIARMLRGSHRLVTLSEEWKQYYQHTFRLPLERVVVLPNPVLLPTKLPNRSHRSTVTLLFLGRMGHIKGSMRVVQAVRILPEEVRARTRLILAGDGDVDSVRRAVNEMGMERGVTVMDWVTAEQRNALLAGADVLVLPSLNEGLPMSVLEAMSWGLPVIASPVGGIPEVVKDGYNGLLVPATDIPAISAAIGQLVEDEPLRLQMGENARTSVEGLDISCYWQNLRSLYQSVLSGDKQCTS
ncbi:MAG: glycosyltransferase family 4 protein [Armatimonadota bacterium]